MFRKLTFSLSSSSTNWPTLLFVCIASLNSLYGQSSAPADHLFKGFQSPNFWREIYIGHFDSATKVLPGNDFDMRAQANYLKALHSFIYVRYHNAWGQSCAQESTEPVELVVRRLDTVVHRNGQEIAREPGKEHLYRVRSRYLLNYRIAERLGGIDSSFPKRPAAPGLTADIARLFQSERCDSQILRVLEENLDRLFSDRPPLQTSGGEGAPVSLFHAGCVKVVSTFNVGGNVQTQCDCIFQKVREFSSKSDIESIEMDFTKERFLRMSFSRIGLHQSLRQCFQGGI